MTTIMSLANSLAAATGLVYELLESRLTNR